MPARLEPWVGFLSSVFFFPQTLTAIRVAQPQDTASPSCPLSLGMESHQVGKHSYARGKISFSSAWAPVCRESCPRKRFLSLNETTCKDQGSLSSQHPDTVLRALLRGHLPRAGKGRWRRSGMLMQARILPL